MQTFLPYADFYKTASVLDNRRLGKQRVEVLQILKAIHGETKGWSNHPATRMWNNNINALVLYGQIICKEWINRGFNDSCFVKLDNYIDINKTFSNPKWIGNSEFHLAHKCNLLRKDYDYYSAKFKNSDQLDINKEYIWPV